MKTVEEIIKKIAKNQIDYNIFLKFNSKNNMEKMSLTNLIRKAISDGYIQKTDNNILKITKTGKSYLNKLNGIIEEPIKSVKTKKINVDVKNAKLDSEIISNAYNIKTSFSDELINIANEINNNASFIDTNRVDYRELNTITIDSEESRDLDDAFSIEKIDNEKYKLYIHISDVGHFIELNSKLDLAARERGNSTYLIDTVHHMFPEILSTNIISLNEKVDRFTLTLIVEVSKSGNIKFVDVCKSIINSNRKLSYKYVQDIIDRKINNEENWLLELIDNALIVKNILFKNRIENGSIEFNNSDIKIVLNEDGIPIEFNILEKLESSSIIEEFMILANNEIAKQLHSFEGVIYRYHGLPDEYRFNNFKILAHNKGYELKKNSDNTYNINEFLENLKGSEDERLLVPVLLRSMNPSSYSITQKSHFGLGCKYYTYFTSPIRRYVDLLIHRIVKEILIDKKTEISNDLKEVCISCVDNFSILDKSSKKAENYIKQIKASRYMKDKLGDEYYGIISSISNKGIFVEIEGLEIEGFIESQYVGANYRFFNDTQSVYIDKVKAYELGDRIRILVASTDVESGKINFSL